MELKVRTSESALIRTAWWEFYLLYWKTNKQKKKYKEGLHRLWKPHFKTDSAIWEDEEIHAGGREQQKTTP